MHQQEHDQKVMKEIEIKYIDQVLSIYQGKMNKEAVMLDDKNITYGELIHYSNVLATLLIENQIEKQDRIAIYLEKSIVSIISIFGILKAGATYVPVDTSIPNPRLEYILQNCSSKLVITDYRNFMKLKKLLKKNNQKVLLINDYKTKIDEAELEKENVIAWNPDVEVRDIHVIKRSEDDIAYIIYTSGSTGTPKGVMIQHKSVVAFVNSVIDLGLYSIETRYLNVSPLFFDASVVDIYCTFLVGGTLVLLKQFVLPSRLLNTMEKYRITDTLLVSSILNLLVSKYVDLSKYDLSNLKTIWYGAEACPRKVIKIIKEALPQVKFIHGYGPTEATHSTTLYIFDEVLETEEEFLPIGKPLPNIKVIALNKDNRPISPGEIGMLYVGGKQLFAGYCNDEEKNRLFVCENFLGTGERYFKTNDYVTIDEQGNFLYRGRKDDMVKISGKLVYINEVEAAIIKYENVQEAYVISIKDELFNSKLICYVVFKDNSDEAFLDLTKYLREILPVYMHPQKCIVMKSCDIPKTPNGKVNYRELESIYNAYNR